MNFLQRPLFPLLLSLSTCLGLAPTLVYAKQILQPASVLPWQAPLPELKLKHGHPVPDKSNDSPAWLSETAEQSPNQADLPMVESESFAHLGQLHRGSSTAKRRPTQQSGSGKPAESRSFNLFRSLGIKGPQSGNQH